VGSENGHRLCRALTDRRDVVVFSLSGTHARLCIEQQLSSAEAQLALAALNALPGPGVRSAVQSLAAACETHGLGREVQVLEAWIAARAAAR